MVSREELFDSLTKKGVQLDGYYNEHKMLLTRITATYRDKTYDTGFTINEHCYFKPTLLRAFGYFLTEPKFKNMMTDFPELCSDYPEQFHEILAKIT